MTGLGDDFFRNRLSLSGRIEESIRQKLRGGLGLSMIRSLEELQGENMSTSPIGDSVQQSIDDQNGHHEYSPRLESMAPLTPASFMGDLLDAQHDFMNAQHQYMQDSNINALLAAQMNFITAQAEVLKRLGVFG